MMHRSKTTPVAIAWDISLSSVLKELSEDNTQPIAIELLSLCSYLAPEKISRDFLLSWLKYAHPTLLNPELMLNRHIGLLWKYSMINYTDQNNLSIHPLLQTMVRSQLPQFVQTHKEISNPLTLKWHESLLQFFIQNESHLKQNNSFTQLIEIQEHLSSVFHGMFKKGYNDNIANFDLTIAPVYFYQERYEDFGKLLDKVNLYLSTKPNREFLKSKIAYLYSGYYRQKQDYKLAEQKIVESLDMFNKIKTTNLISDKEISILKGKILMNKARVLLVKRQALSSQNKESDITSIKLALKLTYEATSIFTNNQDIRNAIQSVALRGEILVSLHRSKEVIQELLVYQEQIDHMIDNRVKVLFYHTYGDAYVDLKDFSQALKCYNIAKNIAEKLELHIQKSVIDAKIEQVK